ncbi:unnamed protein product [Didymodactylos carnosus]|uniref:Nose resistant-to-fluoxetine protein N-terminal domain-containing protein n=1 Tax=Didymodactylos carnosus TaxID=1234261 RepID=A0A813ZY09_9BILA|nr:unnamed protein product [Didymodactylos carnosus]CAF1005128.1 unnamed protein product [Didymodactylos carnosus]CAF3688074.1 unnamed protein product [Didymodactylos carnosus]CAF3774364.1 unnamed protein product [Didymodactylos carnosus]
MNTTVANETNLYECIPAEDRYCYLINAINTIVYGLNNTGPGFSANLDQVPDNLNLNEILGFSLQYLAQYFLDYPQLAPADWDFIKFDLFRIINLLDTQGTSAVFFVRDLKYYIQRFVTQENAVKLALLYLRNAPKNFQDYILHVYLGEVKTPKCRFAMATWFQDIQNPLKNTWAFRMFDASGKPPSNLLAANINWMGDWRSCHKVSYGNKTTPLNFKGKYCRAKIRASPELLAGAGGAVSNFPGDPATLAAVDLGLCVPDYCEESDIVPMVRNTLQLLTIHQQTFIAPNGVYCEKDAEPDFRYYISITLIAILTVIVILATLYDCFYRACINKPFASMNSLTISNAQDLCNLSSREQRPHAIYYANLNANQYQFSNRLQLHGMSYKNEPVKLVVQQKRKIWYKQFIYRVHQILIDLSAYTSILKPMSQSGAMQCLNGLRVISMIWIIWGHTYNYLGDQSYFLLVQNALDLLDFQKRLDAQLIINALYGVDTFFVISAMLASLSIMRMLKKNGMPRWYVWLLMYVERYLRLIPPYIMIFLLYIYVVPHIGSGPLWTAKDFPMKNEDCHNYWWAYFLLINNFVPGGRGTRCLGYFWYVSNDFQLFLLCPLLIVPLYYYPIVGSCILIGVLIASTMVLMGNVANTYIWGNIIVTLQEIWEDTYIKPYCRAGPYVIGIFLGYILFKTDKKKVYLHPLWHLVGWLFTIAFMGVSLFGGFQNHKENPVNMSVTEYTLYFALSRISWPLAVSWIIFSCYKGLAPLVDSILSWRGFTFFAHISYTTYLIHPMIMVYYLFAQQSLFHATDITLLYMFLGHVIFALLLGFAAHIIFERTFGVVIGLILPKRRR